MLEVKRELSRVFISYVDSSFNLGLEKIITEQNKGGHEDTNLSFSSHSLDIRSVKIIIET